MFHNTWVFSKRLDPLLFVLPYVVGLSLVLTLQELGMLYVPMYAWLYFIVYVLLDVPHVFATVYRTYLEPEFRRDHKRLLTLTPLAIFIVAAALFISGQESLLWSIIIYLNIAHIARQQYIYMQLATRDETDRTDRIYDAVAITNVLVYPILWWHTHLPRAYGLQEGKAMLALPLWVSLVGLAVYWGINAAYVTRQVRNIRAGKKINLSKYLVLVMSALTYSSGIILFNSEMAFLALGVFMHSGTYLFLIHQYGRHRFRAESGWVGRVFQRKRVYLYYLSLVAIAYLGESFADSFFRHRFDDMFLFSHIEPHVVLALLVGSCFVIPQIMHYTFDLFLWNKSEKLYQNLGYR